MPEFSDGEPNSLASGLSQVGMTAAEFAGMAYLYGRKAGKEWLAKRSGGAGRLALACSAAELDGYAGGFLNAVWKTAPEVSVACCWLQRSAVDLAPGILIHVYQNYFDPWPEVPIDLLVITLLVDAPQEVTAIFRKVNSKHGTASVSVRCAIGPEKLSLQGKPPEDVRTVQVYSDEPADKDRQESVDIIRDRMSWFEPPILPTLIAERVRYLRNGPRPSGDDDRQRRLG